MDCKEIRKNISLYIDGQLPGNELSGFENHISKCGECAKIMEETRFAVKTVSELSKKPLPAGFYGRLNDKLDKLPEKTTMPKPVFGWNYAIRSIATVLTILIAFVLVKEIKREQPVLKGVITETDKKPVSKSELKIKKEKKSIAKRKILPGLDREEEIAKDKRKILPGFVEKEEMTVKRKRIDELSVAAPEQKLSKKKQGPALEISAKAYSNEKKALDADAPAPVIKKMGEKTFREEEVFMLEEVADKTSGFSSSISNVGGSGETSGKDVASSKLKAEKSAVILDKKASEPKERLGYSSSYTGAGTRVFSDSDSWKTFWREHTEGQFPSPVPLVIDFDKEIAVAVFTGQKPAEDHWVQIMNIDKLKDKIVVSYKEIVLTEADISSQVRTPKYHIKIIEKTNLPVIFKKTD